METTSKRKFDLEDRLITFSILIMEIIEKIPDTRIGNHLAGQLIRSGTSCALNYGEAQSAESRNDFIHKMKIILKELRESNIASTIILRKPLLKMNDQLDKAMHEKSRTNFNFYEKY